LASGETYKKGPRKQKKGTIIRKGEGGNTLKGRTFYMRRYTDQAQVGGKGIFGRGRTVREGLYRGQKNKR